LAFGLAAMTGLMASESRAASLTISVMQGSTTIYSTTGGATKVTANVTALNADLIANGLGGYSFSSLGGSSNNPGTSGPVGGYIITTGTLDVTPGGAGEGTPLTVVLTQSGFTAPASGTGSMLSDTATANYVGVLGGSTQSNTGTFSDSSSPAVTGTAGPITQTYTGSSPGFNMTVSTPLAAYVTPYTLTSTSMISLTGNPAGSQGSDGFSNQVQVISTSIPEPASIVMMLTGMPLPLVVLGLLRRRRATA
jgi:hypothetical protein